MRVLVHQGALAQKVVLAENGKSFFLTVRALFEKLHFTTVNHPQFLAGAVLLKKVLVGLIRSGLHSAGNEVKLIRREVLELLQKKSKNEGKSVIVSSHITDDIMRTADLVTFLIEGKIVLASEKDELLSNWKRVHYKKGSLGSEIVNSLTRRKDHAFGSSGVTDRYLEIKESLVQGITEGVIKIENVNLDDILISLVKGV